MNKSHNTLYSLVGACLLASSLLSCLITHAYDNKAVSMQDVCTQSHGFYSHSERRIYPLSYEVQTDVCNHDAGASKQNSEVIAKELNP